jgi:hypothetical protein
LLLLWSAHWLALQRILRCACATSLLFSSLHSLGYAVVAGASCLTVPAKGLMQDVGQVLPTVPKVSSEHQLAAQRKTHTPALPPRPRVQGHEKPRGQEKPRVHGQEKPRVPGDASLVPLLLAKKPATPARVPPAKKVASAAEHAPSAGAAPKKAKLDIASPEKTGLGQCFDNAPRCELYFR